MENQQMDAQEDLDLQELTSINGGIHWFVAGLIVYVAGEVLDGIVRYADGERSR
ncbi:hypothetical protein [Spirosoma panaciterrae]|uniref:hypothetical protein n=1 Tax=Spirosoma panaciterrae TaxID=496058 RepID=UPI0003A885F5|nr:hypothetical protein [Spirosoma panaciterrae]